MARIKRLLYLLVCCCMLLNAAHAQDLKILREKIDLSKSDEEKSQAYSNLIQIYSLTNVDSAYYYADKGLQWAIGQKYLFGEAQMTAQLCKIDQAQGRMDLAKQRATYALKIYTRLGKQQGVAKINNSLGSIEATMGNYDAAMRYFIASLKMYDSIRTDLSGIMMTNMNIGCLYMQNDDTANAGKYLARAEAVSRKIPVSDLTISLYNYIAILHANSGDRQGALRYFKENVAISDKPEFTISHVECLTYLGNFYSDINDYKTAMSYLQKGLDIAIDQKMFEAQVDILVQMASIAIAADPAKAMALANRAKAISDGMNNKVLKMDVSKQIADIYHATGNYKEEIDALNVYQTIKDSIYKVNKVKEIASLGAIYELEKSNIKIDEISRQRNTVITVTIAIILALVAVVILYLNTRKLNIKLVKHEAELTELSNTKNKLFSIIGHDLRWPVARIPTILEIIDDEDMPADERRYLIDSLLEHTKATVETLDKLLYWGQSLMKGLQINQEVLYSKQYLAQAIDLRKIAAADKKIIVTDHTREDLKIYTDATHFDFIVRNLLGNAIKFTPAKGSIDFNADENQQPGFVIFSIKDTGVGIDADRLHKIFEPFNSKEGTANEKGTGIGLMLCKEFAVKNGGDVWAISEPGKGSTFFISVKKPA